MWVAGWRGKSPAAAREPPQTLASRGGPLLREAKERESRGELRRGQPGRGRDSTQPAHQPKGSQRDSGK